ncbi:DNA-binding PadR family transcriptional regulator [Kitasatospora sp. MAP12-15]|uniref:PadR family transcriptional regulator n=1 Tax=unclassified Kitasatospora TaxID=2633591 RepID=UPI0024735B38|nr:PadR family transcriptional regulator [Kitasatospora sp. MAP12-44]MDH6108798.1 DNA-binding PadR family transcriptional regulator [Kitasatospora sp. MAP12-44]
MSTHRSSPLALTVLALLHYKPLHPYGLQRLVKEWGKDLVVNVGQRASLYRTIDRLQEAGLVAVRETGRDQAYPERTVYEVTDAGREVAREWLVDMLAVPKQEFPQFPVALSNLLMLTPVEITAALERRVQAMVEKIIALEAMQNDERAQGLPRVSLLEVEYLRAVSEAEVRWLRSVVEDLRSGRLSWSAEELGAAADAGAGAGMGEGAGEGTGADADADAGAGTGGGAAEGAVGSAR